MRVMLPDASRPAERLQFIRKEFLPHSYPQPGRFVDSGRALEKEVVHEL